MDTIPKAVKRGMRIARNSAKLSVANFRLGAALYNGNKLISIGWNQRKTHPLSTTRFKTQHAEFSCLVGMNKEDVIGSTLYVFRLTKTNRPGMALPCDRCQELIRAAGIRKVWYSNDTGGYDVWSA